MLHATHRRWPIQWRETGPVRASFPRALLTPDFPIPRGLDPQAAALLPNIDYNLAMLAGLVERPAHTVVNDIACCYAADPFFNAERFGNALRKRGLNAVSNWPSGILFGPSFAGLMDQVDLGYARELKQMSVLGCAGFGLYPVVSDASHARRAIAELAPSGLMLALPPGLTIGAAELADRIGEIVRVTEHAIPVIALRAERGAGIEQPLSGAIVCT